jgi:hypothetical protein
MRKNLLEKALVYQCPTTTCHSQIAHASVWCIRRMATFCMLYLMLLASPVKGQVTTDMDDESRLYAASKQVNQFFRRFNGEEDEKGNRYYPGDKLYQDTKLRKKYLGILFDASNSGIKAPLKVEFANYVMNKQQPAVLNFHGTNWFSEVHATFTLYGKSEPVTLFMELEKDHLGSKWVIQKVHSETLAAAFSKRDTAKVGRFLHPLSHELDFMNLRKAFDYKDSVNQYAIKSFVPDQLSVFLYEVKKGNLKFKNVDDVKFHFFQIEGWYFELSAFNRPGYNTGWLISNLVKLNNPSEKEILRKYLYYENR